ncbi:MAG TPA: MFS transporter [Rhizomicrobium sp.]|nr:MFS transporter [Rhizomicrobium sp.]
MSDAASALRAGRPMATLLAQGLRALRHRNFQLFFAGQGISVIGTWMTRVATGWLVYRLTHSALLLGVASFAAYFISFVLGPFAGAWVERLDRRRLLLATQAVAALQSLALAALTLAHVITIWEIVALAALQGLVNAFDMPARQSFLVQLVDRRSDLGNAIAINSSMVSIARLIGPALAGVIIGATNEGWCFLVDGISYLAVIASLCSIDVNALPTPVVRTTLVEQMQEGWNYVRGFAPLRTILVLFALVSLMGYPYMVLMPVFAAQVLHGGPYTLGWLSCASGLGALVSGFSLALRGSTAGLARMVQIATGVLGLALVLFGLSHSLWLSLLLLVFAGFGLIQVASAANTVIQSLVTDDKRARVMSYYTMAFFGAAPLGSLLAGLLAQQFGAPNAVIVTGVFCLAAAFWFSCELPGINAQISEVHRAHAFAMEKSAADAGQTSL